MKSLIVLLFTVCLAAHAETEERISKKFSVQPGGKLVVDVDFGSIELGTNATSEVIVDVVRKVTLRRKADEEEFLRDRPVIFLQDGNTVTIRSKAKSRISGWRRMFQKTEGKYTISVPAQFNAKLNTAGGGIGVTDIEGEVNAGTSGGGLKFTRVRGPLDGGTSGGGVRVHDCNGRIKVGTSGGGIEVAGGAGSLEGSTSGGSVSVKEFQGPVRVGTSGGGINIENVVGLVEGSTSGGSISARFSSRVSEPVTLKTSGGGVTVRLPADSAFDLDASTSGGGVSSDLPITIVGKAERDHMKGSVNGGGRPMLLRSSGGSIQVKKL